MKNIDWKSLGFGYLKTDYNVRSYYKNGSWGPIEVTSDETITLIWLLLHYIMDKKLLKE